MANNWFVTTNGTGSGSITAGTQTWTTAWSMATLTSNFTRLSPGDTVWLAGGSYSTALIIHGINGTAANPIKFYRVQATDPVGTGFTGWNSAFDSQVVFQATTGTPVLGIADGSFIIVDGRLNSGSLIANTRAYGIKCLSGANGGVVTIIGLGWPLGSGASATCDSIQWRNIDTQGTYANSFASPASTNTDANYGLDMVPFGNPIPNLLIHDCRYQGLCEAIRKNVNDNMTIEYSCILNTEADSQDHEDIIIGAGYKFNGFTCRYNVWSICNNDGMAFDPIGFTNFRFYGNVFYNCGPFWYFFINGGSNKTAVSYHVYNNVFASFNTSPFTIHGRAQTANSVGGWVGSYQTGAPNSCLAGCDAYNNIFLGTLNKLQNDTNCVSQFNAYDATPDLLVSEGPTGIVASTAMVTSWFVNPTAGDFHLTPAGVAALGNGKALAADGFLNKDMDGNTRGGSGPWYRGAYDVASGGGTTLSATVQIRSKATKVNTPLLVHDAHLVI